MIRRYCLPQRKLHILKFFRKEERSFEWSILMKRKIEQTYSDIIAKHANGRVWNFFSKFIIFLKREIIHYFVNFFKVSGRSIEEILISTLLYISYISLDSLKKFKMYFWRINDWEIKFLTLDRTYFLCWVIKTAGVANHRRAAKRSFTIAVNNPRVYVSQWKRY